MVMTIVMATQEFSPYDVELKTRLMLPQVINKGILLPIAIVPIPIPIPIQQTVDSRQ